MQIFATFEHSVQIELAITNIEKMGISDIYAVPLDNGPEDIKLFDTRSVGRDIFIQYRISSRCLLFSYNGLQRLHA